MNFHYLTVFTLVIFIISYIHDRRKLINGFLFNLVLLTTLISFILIADHSGNLILYYVSLAIGLVIASILSFGVFIVWFVSLFNAIRLIRREGFGLANSLTLLIAIGIVGIFVLSAILNSYAMEHVVVQYILTIMNFIVFYFIFIFANFYMSSVIYSLYKPLRFQKYIIVLGSGLLGGKEVTPLLAKRVDTALKIYLKQKKKNPERECKIIMSGGQGADEIVSEAAAMKAYALKQGIVETDIVCEEQATTTYENMLYSKQLIVEQETNKRYRVVFTTSNYHVFRASLEAKRVSLKAQGVGAKTPFYFWYNALLREFVAVVARYLKIHIIFITLVSILIGILYYLVEHPESLDYFR